MPKLNQLGQIKIIILLFSLLILAIYSLKAPQSTRNQDFISSTEVEVTQGCIPVTGQNSQIIDTGNNKLGRAKLVLTNLYISAGNLAFNASTIIDKANNGTVFTRGKLIERNGKIYDVLYPAHHLRINDTNVSPRDYGLSFLIEVQKDGTVQSVKVTDRSSQAAAGKIKKGKYVLADVYQSLSKSQPLPQEIIDSCQIPVATQNASTNNSQADKIQIKIPPQSPSPDKQELQLEYFLFDQATFSSSGGFWNLHCKPAIYLYPKEKTKVNVKIKTKGELTYTDPTYPQNGWDVLAYPDGKLEYASSNNQLRTLNYLYYESKVPDGLIDTPQNGFVVSFDKLLDLYQNLLPKHGLNEQQTKDFTDYWHKALPYSPYYFVGVINQQNINEFEPLEITPKPDYIERVRLYFQALDKKPSQTLNPNELFINHKSPILNPNFKVIEWGGMVKSNPLHPFTCSQ